ncbi:MAG: hypothetical protein U0350_02250 [Caldilineaceae bacterium]
MNNVNLKRTHRQGSISIGARRGRRGGDLLADRRRVVWLVFVALDLNGGSQHSRFPRLG